MKKLFYACLLSFAVLLPVAPFTACSTPPSQRVQTVQTLKVVGASADASMKLAAQLLHDHKITRAQWDVVASFFDNRFQPAYALAVTSVQANLDSPASLDIMNLSSQLASIITSYLPPPK